MSGIASAVWDKEINIFDRPAAPKLDNNRLYYSDELAGRGTTIFRPGLIEKGLIELNVIFPKEERLVVHTGNIKHFVLVDPVWLGGLYNSLHSVVNEFRRLADKE